MRFLAVLFLIGASIAAGAREKDDDKQMLRAAVGKTEPVLGAAVSEASQRALDAEADFEAGKIGEGELSAALEAAKAELESVREEVVADEARGGADDVDSTNVAEMASAPAPDAAAGASGDGAGLAKEVEAAMAPVCGKVAMLAKKRSLETGSKCIAIVRAEDGAGVVEPFCAGDTSAALTTGDSIRFPADEVVHRVEHALGLAVRALAERDLAADTLAIGFSGHPCKGADACGPELTGVTDAAMFPFLCYYEDSPAEFHADDVHLSSLGWGGIFGNSRDNKFFVTLSKAMLSAH